MHSDRLPKDMQMAYFKRRRKMLVLRLDANAPPGENAREIIVRILVLWPAQARTS
jgi:hypothetical protein